MTIEWNKVTWYSKLLAVVLFVLVFYVGFRLGVRWEKEKGNTDINNEISQKSTPVKVTPISISIKNIKEENFSGTMPVIIGSSVVAVEARKYIEKRIADFKVQADTEVPDMRKQFGNDSPPTNYTIDIEATHIKSGKTESIVISEYVYTGGANGNSAYKVFTSSLLNGKILSMSDVIKKDKQTIFTEFVKKELNAWRPEGSDASPVFIEDVKNLKFSSFINWSQDGKNLIIYFDKYEIGPGALGAVAFPLSLNKVKDFMN